MGNCFRSASIDYTQHLVRHRNLAQAIELFYHIAAYCSLLTLSLLEFVFHE